MDGSISSLHCLYEGLMHVSSADVTCIALTNLHIPVFVAASTLLSAVTIIGK
jgi:hypothetical protein